MSVFNLGVSLNSFTMNAHIEGNDKSLMYAFIVKYDASFELEIIINYMFKPKDDSTLSLKEIPNSRVVIIKYGRQMFLITSIFP